MLCPLCVFDKCNQLPAMQNCSSKFQPPPKNLLAEIGNHWAEVVHVAHPTPCHLPGLMIGLGERQVAPASGLIHRALASEWGRRARSQASERGGQAGPHSSGW